MNRMVETMRLNNIFRKNRLFLIFISSVLLCVGLTSCASKSGISRTEVYFSSKDAVEIEIIKEINNSRESIDIAIFDFTSEKIKSYLEEAANRGVEIRIVADIRQAGGSYSVVNSLSEGIVVKIINGKSGGVMHHKFAIFDESLLLTGSYNWTKNAEERNLENAIFIRNKEIVKQYQKEFDAIWRDE